MENKYVIEGKNIRKTYGKFTLDMPEVKIPKGFATALIGENGAGKTTLLNILAGIVLDYVGNLTFFDRYNDADREKNPEVKERIGYTGTTGYYLPQWTLNQIRRIQSALFENFDTDRYDALCDDMALDTKGFKNGNKKVSTLSDGSRTKLMLAGVFARQTDLLLLDEPASPLDPLMREKLCMMIREYLNENEGEKSVVFSTHNISDMENVTDYAVIVEHGQIVEQGFVEDLKEKYIAVSGELSAKEVAEKVLYSMESSSMGFEGIVLAEHIDALAGLDVALQTPTLSQIVVAVMKNHSRMKRGA